MQRLESRQLHQRERFQISSFKIGDTAQQPTQLSPKKGPKGALAYNCMAPTEWTEDRRQGGLLVKCSKNLKRTATRHEKQPSRGIISPRCTGFVPSPDFVVHQPWDVLEQATTRAVREAWKLTCQTSSEQQPTWDEVWEEKIFARPAVTKSQDITASATPSSKTLSHNGKGVKTRKFIVDSGASYHLISRTHLS